MKKLPKNKNIIVFDGECMLCNNYIKFITRNDSKDYFRFISMQNKDALKRINLRKDMITNNESIILINHDSVKTKSTAVIYILSQLQFPYNLFKVLSVLPTNLLDYFYNFIATRRYKIFGKVDHCSAIYSSEEQEIKHKIIE